MAPLYNRMSCQMFVSRRWQLIIVENQMSIQVERELLLPVVPASIMSYCSDIGFLALDS